MVFGRNFLWISRRRMSRWISRMNMDVAFYLRKNNLPLQKLHLPDTATMGLMVLQGVAVHNLIKGLPDIIKFLSGNMSEEAIEKAMRGGKMGRRMGKVLSKVSRKLTGRNMMSAVAKTRMQFAKRLAVGSTASKAATRGFSKFIAKKIGAIASRMALKLANTLTRLSNPIGWVLFALDGIGQILDLADPEGYNNYTDAAIIEQFRINADLQTERMQIMVKEICHTFFR